jgi:hypothetical protein
MSASKMLNLKNNNTSDGILDFFSFLGIPADYFVLILLFDVLFKNEVEFHLLVEVHLLKVQRTLNQIINHQAKQPTL